jgi:hypothetical protein
MKLFYGLICVIVCGFIACDKPVTGRNGVRYKSAVQYNDYIVSRQTRLMQNVFDFSNAADKNLDSAEKMLDIYTAEAIKTIEEIKGMPPFKRDSSLREAAVSSFDFYRKVFMDDYRRIINLRKKGEKMNVDDIKELKDMVEKITLDEEGLGETLQKAQKNFADNNNMKLMKNAIQKKSDK